MYKQSPLYLKTNTNSSVRKVQIAAVKKKCKLPLKTNDFQHKQMQIAAEKIQIATGKMQIAAENKYDFHLKTNAKSNCPVLV